jgi:hypothetical protein
VSRSLGDLFYFPVCNIQVMLILVALSLLLASGTIEPDSSSLWQEARLLSYMRIVHASVTVEPDIAWFR